MQINPNAASLTQQAFQKGNSSNEATKDKQTLETSKEAVALNISSSQEGISSEDLTSIQDRIQEVSKQLNVNFQEESENFSKANINFFEGSFLSSQSSNIEESAARLLS